MELIAMANPSKQKGTKAETKIVRFMIESPSIDAERRALKGSADAGDIIVKSNGWSCILEVKAGKQTDRYNRKLKEEWLRQTEAESANADLPGFLVVAAFNRSTKDYEVWDSKGERFWYLDEFRDLIAEKGYPASR